MGYAILRTEKIKSGISFRRSLAHAFRAQDTPNADPARLSENSHIGAADVAEALAKFNARLATQDRIRSNAVLAVEYMIGGSPDDMHGKTRIEQDAYFDDALKWLKEKHGEENVVYAAIHRDETTPHMHAYVIPLDERDKLNCRAFLGGAKALNLMQSDFAEKVGKPHALERGIEGSKARHTTSRQYAARVAAAFKPLPEVTTPMPMPAQPKPSIFRPEARGEWERDELIRVQQKADHEMQTRAQQSSAVETARTYHAKAAEAGALKKNDVEQKKYIGMFAKKNEALLLENHNLRSDLSLFSPEQVLEARIKQQKWLAEAEKEPEKEQSLDSASDYTAI